MQGYKTWVGLIVAFLGFFGWSDLISEGQLSELTNLTTQIVGLILAVYGNYHSHREIKALGGYR